MTRPVAVVCREKHRYVINSEAQKEMYISMIKNQPVEPKDLGREWHSDG